MGRRHKKAGTAEVKELRIAALLAQDQKAGLGTGFWPGAQAQMEPALPPSLQPRLSCRHLGYFRGRRIFETRVSLLHLH